MRLVKIIAAVTLLAVVSAGLYGFGAHLPETSTVSVRAIYKAPSNDLWKTIGDVAGGAPVPGNLGATRLPDEAGHAVWRLTDARGRRLDVAVIGEIPGRRQVIRVLRSDLPVSASRIFELEPRGSATLVTLSEESRVPSPLWRLILRSFGSEERDVRQTLERIGSKVGEHPQIAS